MSWDAHQRQCLQTLGLSDVQIEVVCWLEPTKWYSRLLGDQAIQSRLQGSEMPQARPYQVHTPLNRVVDFLSPESLSARHALDETDLPALVEKCDRALAQMGPGIDDDVLAAITVTREALQLAQDVQAGTRTRDEVLAVLEDRYQAYGEYMPALIPQLIDLLADPQ